MTRGPVKSTERDDTREPFGAWLAADGYTRPHGAGAAYIRTHVPDTVMEEVYTAISAKRITADRALGYLAKAYNYPFGSSAIEGLYKEWLNAHQS